MTAYPGIALPLYSHGRLIALVLSLGTLWEIALGGVLLSPSVILVCWEQDCPRQRHLAVWTFFVRPWTFLPLQRGPWAWYEMGRGCQSLQPHNNNMWSFIILFYKFLNFECYMIVHYKYLLPMWITILFC